MGLFPLSVWFCLQITEFNLISGLQNQILKNVNVEFSLKKLSLMCLCAEVMDDVIHPVYMFIKNQIISTTENKKYKNHSVVLFFFL